MAWPLYAGLAAFQLYSGLTEASAIRRQAKLQNRINQMNAKYAELDAYEAEKFGYTQQARYQSTVDQTIGQQRAGYASQNVDVSTGTAAETQADTRTIAMLNMLDIQAEARKRALGLKMEASNIRLGAGMLAAEASAKSRAAITQGVIGAAQTGLAGWDRYGRLPSYNKLGSSSSSSGSYTASTDSMYEMYNANPRQLDEGTTDEWGRRFYQFK